VPSPTSRVKGVAHLSEPFKAYQTFKVSIFLPDKDHGDPEAKQLKHKQTACGALTSRLTSQSTACTARRAVGKHGLLCFVLTWFVQKPLPGLRMYMWHAWVALMRTACSMSPCHQCRAALQ
jgi:hypothetical protein